MGNFNVYFLLRLVCLSGFMLTPFQVNGGTLRGTTWKQETSSITEHTTPWVPPQGCVLLPTAVAAAAAAAQSSLTRAVFTATWRRCGFFFFFTGHIINNSADRTEEGESARLLPSPSAAPPPSPPPVLVTVTDCDTVPLHVMSHVRSHQPNRMHLQAHRAWKQLHAMYARLWNIYQLITQTCQPREGKLWWHLRRDVQFWVVVFFRGKHDQIFCLCMPIVCLFVCLFFSIFHLLIWRIKISRAQTRKLLLGSLLLCKKKKVLSSQKLLLLISPYQAKIC